MSVWTSQTEISQEHLSARIQQQVRRLDVAMQDSSLMSMFERPGRLLTDHCNRTHVGILAAQRSAIIGRAWVRDQIRPWVYAGSGEFPADRSQVRPVDQRHEYVRLCPRRIDLKDRQDVGVAKLGD